MNYLTQVLQVLPGDSFTVYIWFSAGFARSPRLALDEADQVLLGVNVEFAVDAVGVRFDR